MKCTQCGYENKEGAASCNLCGAVLKRPDGSPAPPGRTGPSRDSIFPDPTALSADPNAPLSPTLLDAYNQGREETAHKGRYWLIAGGACIVIAVIGWVIFHLPYSPEKVDAMYAGYVANHPNSTFPDSFTRYQARRVETADYIFQFVHAYEQTFVDQDPYEKANALSEERRKAAESGQPDPGASPSARDEQTLKRIDDTEAVTKNLYGVGQKPFDTLRSLAGGDERGREQRNLEMDLVAGRKETQLKQIENDRANRVHELQNYKEMTREELDYFIREGTPKLRSIASRLKARFFSDNSAK